MLDDEIYAKVAASLKMYFENGTLWCWPYGKEYKDFQSKDQKEADKFIEKEVSEWRRQNAISFDKRYKEDNGEIEPMKFKEVWAVSEVQLYKWLNCIEYQIETNYESILMMKAIRELAHKIINKSPEYDKAKWAL